MRNSVLLLILFHLHFFACKETESKSESSSCDLGGIYFNRTILDRCPLTMPSDIPYYALELSFITKDSINIDNGIEKFKLPIVRAENGCHFTILGATQFGDMHFDISGDTILHLYDTAWTGLHTYSTFARDRQDARKNWDFDNYFNECMIAGTYTYKDQNGTSSIVYFLPNGQVSGIKPYLSYSLCYAGDCLEEIETPAATIDFTTNKGTTELFVIIRPEGRSRVQFYKVSDPIPGLKGGRKIGDKAFEITAGIQNE